MAAALDELSRHIGHGTSTEHESHCCFFGFLVRLFRTKKEMSDLSATAKLTICTDFVKSAPPGEVNEVLKCMRRAPPALVGSHPCIRPSVCVAAAVKSLAGALDPSAEAAMRHDYNIDQMLVAGAQDGSHKLLICACSEIDSTHYIDPVARKAMRPSERRLSLCHQQGKRQSCSCRLLRSTTQLHK